MYVSQIQNICNRPHFREKTNACCQELPAKLEAIKTIKLWQFHQDA